MRSCRTLWSWLRGQWGLRCALAGCLASFGNICDLQACSAPAHCPACDRAQLYAAGAPETSRCRKKQLQTCKGVSRQLHQNAMMQVIYGDTDSIMVNTKSTELEQVGVGYSCSTCSDAHSRLQGLTYPCNTSCATGQACGFQARRPGQSEPRWHLQA